MKKMIESAPPMRWHWKKTVLIMKLCLIFTLAFTIQLSASVYSQNARFNLNMKNVSIEKVFNQIKKQSEFTFFYDEKGIKSMNKVSISISNGTAEEILKKCLSGTRYTYEIIDKTIILKKIAVKKLEQTNKLTIKGKVVDEKGNALPGVTVQVQGTNAGVATDNRGRYTIQAKKTDVLKFSFIGYKTAIILIEGKEKIDMKLFPKAESLEEVSVVAFGEQKKESVVSSITTVKADALKSSNSDLTSTFAGKISGLIGWQTGGMPGALTEEEMNTKFYIRGITSFQTDANIDPLILLDGVEVSKLDLARIDPDDIESFNVMKDASATAMYGARGANGVIYVKTKKGKDGDVYTSFRYERIWSMPTSEIDVVSPIDYMKYFNAALTGRNPNISPKYTAEKIKRTASGKYPDYVYPATDWYKQLFKDKVLNNHYALNVRGGNSKIQYYASITYNDDEGMIKTDQLNQFDCNITNKQTTFRTNLNINLTKTAKLTLNSFTTYDVYNGPLIDIRQAYALAFNANPVDFAPVYPADDLHDWPHIRFGGSNDSANPYGAIHAGYKEKKRYSTINKLEYIQNLASYCKGLEFRFSTSLSKVGYYSTAYETVAALYSLSGYDATTNKHTLIPLNEDQAKRTLLVNKNKSEIIAQTSVEYQAKLMHNASWGNHQTSITLVASSKDLDNSIVASVQNSLPHRNLSYAARLSYGYKDRYFIESSCGYNGSERFSEKNRMGFFPSAGFAWIVSKEDFLRSTNSWLDYLKIRLSYGKVGNDGVIKEPRFVYLENIVGDVGTYGTGTTNETNSFYYVGNYANEETTWEVAEQSNLGLETKLFNGLLDINLDVYQEVRHNIYSYRTTLPSSMGLKRDPLDNIGKVKAHGLDFSGKIQHAFNSDSWFIINGTFTYNKAKFQLVEEATGKNSWQKKVGREISQQFGYIAEGVFHDQEEINNSPYQAGNVQPGDIKYRDVDGNGIISVQDAVAIGYPETPRIIYGLSGIFHYKSFDFSIAFQGSGNRSFWIDPQKVSPFSENRALLTAIANDHWTEGNQKDMPLWPRLSTENITAHNPQENYYSDEFKEVRKSTYFMRNGKFLRCKNIELGFYLNKNWLKKYSLRKCKFYLRANNPFVISDFKLWDVELGESGFNYPIQKTYTLGVNLSF